MSGGFVVFHRRDFCEVTSKSRPAWLQDGSVVAVTFRNWKPIVFQSNQSGLLSLSKPKGRFFWFARFFVWLLVDFCDGY